MVIEKLIPIAKNGKIWYFSSGPNAVCQHEEYIRSATIENYAHTGEFTPGFNHQADGGSTCLTTQQT